MQSHSHSTPPKGTTSTVNNIEKNSSLGSAMESSSIETTNNNNNNIAVVIIENFRQAAGVRNVYRCASTDGLGAKVGGGGNNCNYDDWADSDRFVLQQAGLIFDLRSSSERNEEHAQKWMSSVDDDDDDDDDSSRSSRPIQVVEPHEEYSCNGDGQTNPRFVVRVDVLSPYLFMSYIEANWLGGTITEKAQTALFRLLDGQKLHELRIEALNKRGLAGLNEAILETGKQEICRALKTITLHLEANPDDSVVIHCVQGKDRYVQSVHV